MRADGLLKCVQGIFKIKSIANELIASYTASDWESDRERVTLVSALKKWAFGGSSLSYLHIYLGVFDFPDPAHPP